MGYCTTTNYQGRQVLACDGCGSYPVKKHPCPYGYCKSAHYCPSCWEKAKPNRLQHHANCKIASDEFDRDEKESALIIDDGRLLRRSALNHGKMVKVIFQSKGGNKAYFMPSQTYQSIPIGENATLEDYRRLGGVIEAKNIDIYDEEQEPAAHADI